MQVLLRLVGLRGPEVRDASGTLAAWGGGGLGLILGGLDLGISSGLESSVSAGTTAWTFDCAAG